MSWDRDLRDVVRREFPVGTVFTLDQVYSHEDHFQGLHPSNQHVRDKLRQILQHLRDDGIIEFLDDNGHYRRLK